MAEMSYEILAVILLIVMLVLLCAVYLWLYLLSKRNEEYVTNKKRTESRIHDLFESVIYSANGISRDGELEVLKEYIGDSDEKKDMVAVCFLKMMRSGSKFSESRVEALGCIYEMLDPVKFYKDRLENGNRYEKCYAMRRLSDFAVTDSKEDIEKYIDSKKADYVYNAAMALSEMGDEKATLAFLKKCEKNKKISHRVILECLQVYTGDRTNLVRRIQQECDEYILSSAIKAYTDDCNEDLTDIYIGAMSSQNVNLKVAATKALSHMGNPAHEQRLITALNDKNWIVRLSAVDGLERIATEGALEALVGATQDDEWWVRNAAARAIVNKDFYLVYVEQVLSGYDKYAADAVKDALYKQVKMNGGAFR